MNVVFGASYVGISEGDIYKYLYLCIFTTRGFESPGRVSQHRHVVDVCTQVRANQKSCRIAYDVSQFTCFPHQIQSFEEAAPHSPCATGSVS
jgi:hypothetical protein